MRPPTPQAAATSDAFHDKDVAAGKTASRTRTIALLVLPSSVATLSEARALSDNIAAQRRILSLDPNVTRILGSGLPASFYATSEDISFIKKI